MTDFPQFIDRVGATPGTALDAAHLNALAKAQPYILTGGVLPTTGGLTATMPATSVVINTGAAQAYAAAGSQAFTIGASKDAYFDLDTGGAWHKVEVANGAAAPALTANSLRCCKAVTSGSAITAVYKIAPGGPLPAIVLAAYRVSLNGGESTFLASSGFPWGVVGNPSNAGGSNGASVIIPVRSGSIIRLRLFGQWDANATNPTYVKIRTAVDGVGSARERMTRPNSDNTVRIAYDISLTGLAAGIHTIQLQSFCDGQSWGYNDANGMSGGEFWAEEIGPNP